MIDRVGVAHCSLDGDVEQLADSSDVAAGGTDFVEDAVFAQGSGGEADVAQRKRSADWCEARSGAPVDEQVRVDRGRPGECAVVEPGGESWEHWSGERDGAVGDGEATVGDVGGVGVLGARQG